MRARPTPGPAPAKVTSRAFAARGTTPQLPFDPRPLRVSDVVAGARELLEQGLRQILVEGEVSNFKLAPSGHAYFSLKDESAQLRVVLFRSRGEGLGFRMEDGLQVLVRGTVTVYDARGDLQLQATRVEPTGTGALTLAFEQLKAKLQLEGLFDTARKRRLPLLPRRVALVTSLAGAALHDMRTVLGRRNTCVRVLIVPVRVQGEGSAAEIARAIDRAVTLPDVEVVVVGRGGGSIEDLWAFNEEVVARAIARCPVPVISAVGHESDFTIADLVADLRAPTPSAAAELVSGEKDELARRILTLAHRLRAATAAGIARRRARLSDLGSSRALRAIEARPRQLVLRLDDLGARLTRAASRRIERLGQRVKSLGHDLRLLDVRGKLRSDRDRVDRARVLLLERTREDIARRRLALGRAAASLQALSPLAVLARGYAIASLEGGHVLRSADEARVGDAVSLKLARGGLRCRVEGPE